MKYPALLSIARVVTIIALFSILPLVAQETDNTQEFDSEVFKSTVDAATLRMAPVKLIPYPQKVFWHNEQLPVTTLKIQKSKALSPFLQQELQKICTDNQISISDNAALKLVFSYKKELPKEGYVLKVTKKNVLISAATEAGFFYALQTLRQLIIKQGTSRSLELCEINDWPKFPVRGFMIDVGRNFQSIELLKTQLDIMARYKMNVFHWHLTDRPAWRIESKKYPELIAAKNHRPSRNPGKYYTYEEIRELINYANQRQIMVIPEIDMPGHSDSFRKAMGCRMESAKGMEILEHVLNEFFEEIPKKLAPIIHIGGDEVHIENPKEFVSKMYGVVRSNGRKVVMWSPGLKTNEHDVIKQYWGGAEIAENDFKGIDSKFTYINKGEPMSIVNQLLFNVVGKGLNNNAMGGIICLWPDVNVWAETDIYRQHPVYPALLTYAWTTWSGHVTSNPEVFQVNLPPVNTEAAAYFAAYEAYLIDHKNRFFSHLPFPYYKQSGASWKLIGPFFGDEGDFLIHSLSDTLIYHRKKISWKEAQGNSLTINRRKDHYGYYPNATSGQSVYAKTYIYSASGAPLEAYVNFESPLRANRAYTGIANNGSWDINGGKIWINDTILKGPNWKNPGWRPFKRTGWAFGIDSEIPWTDEELYWLREPAVIHLKKGWNKVVVKIPCTAANQNWMFTFVPLKPHAIKFSNTPPQK